MKFYLKKIMQRKEISVFTALAVIFIIMSFASPYFLQIDNIFNILRNMSNISIMAIGVTMIIITGGVDLSVGSVMAASGMIMARMLYEGAPPIIGIGCGFLSGLTLGAINGLIITKIRVNPFITTLGMLSIARGITYIFATGIKGSVAANIPINVPFIHFIGGGYILGVIPVSVIVMFVLVIVFAYFLKNSVLGRNIYAVGSNSEASRLSGIDVDNVKLFVYAFTGVLCALASIIGSGQIRTAATNAGTGNELDVIAAVIIGGTSLSGGEGTIWGSVIGAAVMAILKNSFVLLKLPSYLQTITIGVIIILAVSIDSIRKRNTK